MGEKTQKSDKFIIVNILFTNERHRRNGGDAAYTSSVAFSDTFPSRGRL